MKSCSLKKITAVFGALLLALCLIMPAAAHAASPGGINTEAALRTMIENAADGAVLLVDDVAFASLNDPVVISKSITLRGYKDHGSAIFYGGAFVIDGSAAKIEVQFDNITFCSDGDAANIADEVWDQDDPLPPAMSFRGNVNARLTGCVFRNYVSFAGANLSADYSSSDAQLELFAQDCSFLGSAVRDRGGAALLLGQDGKDNVIFTAVDCAFTGNISSNRKGALGGGAVYAENSILQFAGCSFSSNEASHQYLLPEAESTDPEAEPVFADYTDLTKGGAIFAADSSLLMKNCRVSQCSASLGGGIALENTEFHFLNGIIAHNRAESSVLEKDREGLKAGTGMGGGLFVSGDRSVDVDLINSSFYGNTVFNAYAGICADGAGSDAMPYAVRLMLCTYAGNTVDTAYNKPEVDRSKFFPKEDETEDEADKGEKEDDKKTDEEKAKEAEEAAKKKAEAEAKAQAAYDKAVADALAKAAWKEVPGDVWDAGFLQAHASVIIDDSFSALKRHKVAYPRYEKPGVVNHYSYFAAPENALADGYMPNVPSAEFTHVIPGEAFREAFPLPDGTAEEYFSPFYDKVMGKFYPGDNTGGGLVCHLMLDNVLWQTLEAKDEVTPVLPVPEKEGHSFDQWQMSDGSAYEAGVSFITGLAQQTLQMNAVMHPNTYTLHFSSEAGTQDVKQVYGTPVTLPAASEKKNYDFVNWYKYDGTVAKDGELYLIAGDSTYTAQYTKQFPMTAVIALSAAIALIALYLIIARIADHLKKTKPIRDAKKAEKAAAKAAEEKQKAEEQARKAQEKVKAKAEEDARKKAEAEAKAKAKAEEEARKAEEKAAKAAAKEAEKAAKASGAEKAGDAAETLAETAEAVKENAEETVSETAEAVKEAAGDAADAANDAAGEALSAGEEAAGEVKDAIAEAADAISDALGSAAETAGEAAEEVTKTAEEAAKTAEEAVKTAADATSQN